MKKTIITLTGMHCEHCAQKIEDAIEQQEGVSKAKVSLKKGNAKVTYDGTAQTLADLVEAVRKAGYQADFKN